MTKDTVLEDLKNLKSKSSDLKWDAITNLRKYLQSNPDDFRSRMIIKSLLPFTKDPDDRIRENVIITLLDAIKDVKSIGSLVTSALSDPSPGIRSLALEWLRNENHLQLKTQAIKALSDPAEVVRKTAMDIIVAHQIEGVESQLLQLLETEKGGLRRSIIYALGKMKTSKAIGALVEIMRNPEYDDWTRNQAGSALEHMGGQELIVPFIENLTDSNDYVRETAAAFIKKSEEEKVTSTVMGSGRIDLIALLQHGTDTTRQNFDNLVSYLTTQMTFIIKDLQTQLLNKDRLSLLELATELQSNVTAVKVLLEKILQINLFPISDDIYFTETGLKRLLTTELENKSSIHISSLQRKEPFNSFTSEKLGEVISSLPNCSQVSKDLFLSEQVFTKISTDFNEFGLLNLSTVSDMIQQTEDLIKKDLIPNLNPSNVGWINSRNEYLTRKYLQNHVKHQIDHYSIISLKKLLSQIGNPKIELPLIREIIEEQAEGKWLENINTFLEITEFQKLEQDSTGVDEARVSHLLEAIDLDFPRFLQSLQKILDVKTYRTRDGQIATLENLHPLLQQHILGKGYISIPNFLKDKKLDKETDTITPIILEYITQEFSGRTSPDGNYFFTEDLIADISKEVDVQTRINFSVLGFKLDIDSEILALIVSQILFVRGFTNTIGEFVTSKGITQEIQGILEFRPEFALQELFDILEITKDKKNESLIREIVSEYKNLILSQDKNVVMTKKAALNKVIGYIKGQTQQTKGLIPWDEIRRETNVPDSDIRSILDSLLQNNLLPGTLQEQGYRP
ncbi:MAG: HEAT repeat domain-containing protein [Candidatus Heimdallarchaeota archaeon]|nr:MAG: HEAT repeat domain-containing protein [Candidatus Heimdallarchaeota archaeon]